MSLAVFDEDEFSCNAISEADMILEEDSFFESDCAAAICELSWEADIVEDDFFFSDFSEAAIMVDDASLFDDDDSCCEAASEANIDEEPSSFDSAFAI